MKNEIIKIKSLSFKYRKKGKQVLKNIDLNVKKGEIFGLLGPNGAGKTTLFHILFTLLKPFRGKIMINDMSLEKNPVEIRKLISVMFQDSKLDKELSGYQTLDFYAKLLRVPNRKKNILWVADFMGLKKELHKKVDTYSGGMKRRLELARCFFTKPKIMLLDEPTTRLDPLVRRKIWDYLKIINKKYGVTIILTTHYTEEADYLCNRIAILDEGKIIKLGSPSELKSSFNINFVKIKAGTEVNIIVSWLKPKNWVKNLVCEDSEIKFILLNPKKNLNSLLAFVNKLDSKVISFECTSLSLDELFIKYVEKGKRK